MQSISFTALNFGLEFKNGLNSATEKAASPTTKLAKQAPS
jgi:hypothetical protein